MSIIIKGMDMPMSCGVCEFNYCLEGGSYEWWECTILHDDIKQFDIRRDDCPLIEIVTCKDCKHRYYEDMCDCIDILPGTEDDFFCPYGERRTNEHTD